MIPDKCVNSGLLNDDILIKTKWYLTNVSIVVYWLMIFWLNKVIPVSMVVYWMMKLWLKEGDTCVNGGLLNDDTLIKIKWYLEIKTKWYLTNVSIVVYWLMIFWLKQSDSWHIVNSGLLNDDTLIKRRWYLCQWWFIEWWYFD